MSNDGCGDARDVGLLQDTVVGSSISPTYPEDLRKTSLVVLLQGLQMSAVGGSAISSTEQCGQNDCFIHKEFGLGLDVPIFKNSLPQLKAMKAALVYPYSGEFWHQ